MMKAQGTVNGIMAVENFIRGFRLGAKIGIEVMGEDDGCFVAYRLKHGAAGAATAYYWGIIVQMKSLCGIEGYS